MDEAQRKAWLKKWRQIRKDRPFTQRMYDELCFDYFCTNETEPPGLGSSKYWLLSYRHHFFLAGLIHDIHYPNRDGFVYHDIDKDLVDTAFHLVCLRLSRHWLDRLQAAIFYKLVKAYMPKDWIVKLDSLTRIGNT